MCIGFLLLIGLNKRYWLNKCVGFDRFIEIESLLNGISFKGVRGFVLRKVIVKEDRNVNGWVCNHWRLGMEKVKLMGM